MLFDLRRLGLPAPRRHKQYRVLQQVPQSRSSGTQIRKISELKLLATASQIHHPAAGSDPSVDRARPG